MPETNMISRLLTSLNIDYSQAILSGRQFAQSLGSINTQLLALQRTARATGLAMGRDMATSLDRNKVIYDQYGRSLREVTVLEEKATRESKKHAQATSELSSARQRISQHFFTQEQAKLNTYLKQVEQKEKISNERRLALEAQYYSRAEQNARQFYQRQIGNIGEISDQMERRFGWFFAGLGFYGAQDVLRRAVTTMGEVEMGMIEIARIQNDVNFNFQDMRQELFDLGKTYGQTWEVVHDISLRWSQAGLNTVDVIEATKASLLALNTAELDAQQSTVGLVGIMSQWGLEATDLIDVIDKINITADNFVVTSQDLVDGLLRSSGSARVLGLSLEETIGMLTAMREASGRTGREAGNALNSIFSFMQRDKAIKTFDLLGIEIWADETKTNFRNVIEIFDQVSERWGEVSDEIKDGFVAAADEAGLFSEELADVVGIQEEWNDLQKRDASQAMAGVYRRNYLLALLQNWSTVQEVLNNLIDAHGYSMRENERTMEAYHKRVESLRMALTELAVAIGEAGLLDTMKGLVDGSKEAIEAFRQLPPPVQDAIIAFVGLTAALAGINLTFRVFMGMGIGSILINLAAHIAGVEAATLGLGAALNILARNPVVLAVAGIAALATAVAVYNKHIRETTQSTIEYFNSSQQNIDSIQKQIEKVESLAERYNKLAGESDGTKESQAKLRNVIDEITSIMPAAITGFDNYGNAIVTVGSVADATRLKVEDLTSSMIRQAELAASVAKSKLPGLEREHAEALEKGSRVGAALRGSAAEQALTLREVGDIKWWNVKGQIGLINPTGVKKNLESIGENIGKEIGDTYQAIEAARQAIETWDAIKSGNYGKKPASTGDGGGGTPNKPKTPGGGGDPNRGSGGSGAGAGDYLREMANQAKLATEEYTIALQNLDSQLQNVAIRERLLVLEMQSGTVPTVEQLQQKHALLSETLYLNTERQNTLSDAMKAAQAELSTLEAKFVDLVKQHESGKLSAKDFNAAVSALRPTINELRSSVNQYKNAWWDAEYNIKSALQSIKQAHDDLSKSIYDNAMRTMQHEVAMARMSTQQQISYMREVYMARQWNTDMGWKMEEDLFKLYRQGLQEEMDAVREAYDERLQHIQDQIDAEEGYTRRRIEEKERRIEAIDAETRAQIEAIQRLIDALDMEGEQSSREEAERQHNKKISDLIEERKYHELRTGIEHQRKIAEINEQIVEEERAWKLKQEEWSREDQKQAYKDEIDALEKQAKTRTEYIRKEIEEIKKASDQKKKELQDYYKDVQKIINNKTIDMLASLATTDEKWYERGVAMMRSLAAGIRDGSTELPSDARDFIGEAEREWGSRPPTKPDKDELGRQAPIATFTAGQYTASGNTAYMHSRTLGSALGVSVDWDASTGRVKMGSKSFTPWKAEGGKTYVGVREVAEALGYRVEFDAGNIFIYPKAHTGAYVSGSGVAELLKGERVLSPQMTVSFDRLANVLDSIPDIPNRVALMTQAQGQGSGSGLSNNLSLDVAVERIIAAIERRRGVQIQNLLNVERADFAERDDMEIMGRELQRIIENTRVAKG